MTLSLWSSEKLFPYKQWSTFCSCIWFSQLLDIRGILSYLRLDKPESQMDWLNNISYINQKKPPTIKSSALFFLSSKLSATAFRNTFDIQNYVVWENVCFRCTNNFLQTSFMGPKVFRTITVLARSNTNGFSSLPDKDMMLYFVVSGC